MKKENRGSYDFRFDVTNEILIVKWLDNKCGAIGTNFNTIDPMSNVLHWKKDEKAKRNIPQPHIFKTYNSSMGGDISMTGLCQNMQFQFEGKSGIGQYLRDLLIWLL